MHTESTTHNAQKNLTAERTADARHQPRRPSFTKTPPAARPIPAAAFRFKTCRSCGREKPLRAFYQQRRCAKRHQRLDCKACTKAETQKRRERRERSMPPAELRCLACRSMHPVDRFALDRRFRSGRAPICAICAEEREAARQERILQRKMQRAANPEDAPATLEMPETPMSPVQHYGALREARIDLGLAIAQATCPAGHCRSREEIAAYTGLSVEGVRRIELRALAKMRAQAQWLLIELELEALLKGEVQP